MCTICKVKVQPLPGDKEQVLVMEASRPYHHEFTRAASRLASNDRQIYNHPYTLLPESIYPVQLDSATPTFF